LSSLYVSDRFEGIAVPISGRIVHLEYATFPLFQAVFK